MINLPVEACQSRIEPSSEEVQIARGDVVYYMPVRGCL